MAVTSISVILTVFVLKLHHCGPRQAEVPSWLRFLALRCMATLVTCRPVSNANRNNKQRRNRKMGSKAKTNGDNAEVCLRLVSEYGHRKHSPVAEFRNSSHKPHVKQEGYNDISTTNLSSDLNHQNHQTIDPGSSLTPNDLRRLKVMEEILRYLKIMVAKRDEDDNQAELVTEWQQVAAILDRFLFWFFLLTTIVSTVVMMVIVPMLRDLEDFGPSGEP